MWLKVRVIQLVILCFRYKLHKPLIDIIIKQKYWKYKSLVWIDGTFYSWGFQDSSFSITTPRSLTCSIHVWSVSFLQLVFDEKFIFYWMTDMIVWVYFHYDVNKHGYMMNIDKTYFDMRVLHTAALSNGNQPLEKMYLDNEHHWWYVKRNIIFVRKA